MPIVTQWLCLYPTFKEWKHRRISPFPAGSIVVYILPLRNENTFITAVIWPSSYVYILPLRNENRDAGYSREFARRVYILPLRNENVVIVWIHWQYHKNGLYPTFKEWKQASEAVTSYATFRLYPTFKEWKRQWYSWDKPSSAVYILPLRNENFRILNTTYVPFCLYPTFKEWKLQTYQFIITRILFISYL